MGESLTQQRRVEDEGFRVVNSFQGGRSSWVTNWTVPPEEATANSVPAAAVRQRVQTLLGITGHKAHVGGLASAV